MLGSFLAEINDKTKECDGWKRNCGEEKAKLQRNVGKRCSYLQKTDRALQSGTLSLMIPVESSPNQEGHEKCVSFYVLTQLNH